MLIRASPRARQVFASLALVGNNRAASSRAVSSQLPALVLSSRSRRPTTAPLPHVVPRTVATASPTAPAPAFVHDHPHPAISTTYTMLPSGPLQDEIHRMSLDDPETFWQHQADQLHWHRKPKRMLKLSERTTPAGITHPTWEWFPGGEISTCYNMVDRHVKAGRGNNVAIYYDSPVTNTKKTITYRKLYDDIEVLAGALREQGVKKGDVVLMYMPMIPAAMSGILAVNRLGATHCMVFGGFSAPALAQRIEAVRPVAILTASCGIDGNKPAAAYRTFIHEAIKISTHKPSKVVIFQRPQLPWPVEAARGEVDWQTMWESARDRNLRAACVPIPSSAPCYINHTSGTTGAPKGVVRDNAGHIVGLHLSVSMVFDVQGPGHTLFAASDIGWVLGHAFILCAPLLTGASTVVYEGKPVGTPDASAFWRIIEEYRVNTMYCAPTALRAIKRDDPDNKIISKYGERGGLRSLRGLFLAGERSEPTIITAYQEILDKYGAIDSHVIDNWWSTEVGSPITSRALVPHAGVCRHSPERHHAISKLKPGSAGKAMPGYDVKIVDDEGVEVPVGEMGNIVIGLPLPPTAFRSLWEDDDRFYRSYLQRFDSKFMDTGDTGYIDSEGYVYVMARSDDVLNVSAHRLSSAAIEQAVASHPLVAEACVVSIPDALKGELPFAFVTLSVPDHPKGVIPDAEIAAEIQQLVRSQVGAIATLGGIIQGVGMIPKTRSGKTLRRVLRGLLHNACEGEFDKEVSVPSTVEDAAVVDAAREKVREYFKAVGNKHKAVEVRTRAKL